MKDKTPMSENMYPIPANFRDYREAAPDDETVLYQRIPAARLIALYQQMVLLMTATEGEHGQQ